MKVLLIDVNCKYSSTGRIVYNLYTQLNQDGDEAAICYGRGSVVEGKNIYKFGLDWETYVHALLTRITGQTGCYSFFSTRRLIRFMKEFKPDVVHIHELHAYFVNISPLLNYLIKEQTPTIWTFHCEFMYTGKCGHAYECTGFMDSCGNCPNLHDYPKSLFIDSTKRMLAQKRRMLNDYHNLTIVTPSEWLASRVRLSFLKNKNIKVIHNGIDTDIFYPRKTDELRKRLNLKDNEKIVLSVAPDIMSESKGGGWVLQLAEMLKNEPIRFILVGAENTDIPLEDNVMIFSRTSNQDELAEFYSITDLFLICSKSETYPTTCLEAQCCGTPICGFDTGGSKETSLGSSANFVKYGDLEGLVEIVKKNLKQNQELMRSDFALSAQKNLSKRNMIKNYLTLYKKV